MVPVPRDLTDRSGSEVRPAGAVSSEEYNEGPDVLSASITSNNSALPHPGDLRIREWKAAGLLKPSLVQTKLATIEASLIRRKLGELRDEDLEAFDAGLREALIDHGCRYERLRGAARGDRGGSVVGAAFARRGQKTGSHRYLCSRSCGVARGARPWGGSGG